MAKKSTSGKSSNTPSAGVRAGARKAAPTRTGASKGAVGKSSPSKPGGSVKSAPGRSEEE